MEDDGSIVVTIKISPAMQDKIIPYLLNDNPYLFKDLGLTHETYWDFPLHARETFQMIAVRINLYPTKEQIKKVLLKERVTPLKALFYWVRYVSSTNKPIYPWDLLDKSYARWLPLIKECMEEFSTAELKRIWDRSDSLWEYLYDIVPLNFIPLILKELNVLGHRETLHKAQERLKS